MSRWLGGSLAILSVIATIGALQAQDTQKPKLDVDAVFKRLDTNKDSKLAKEEFLRLADQFKDKEKAEKLTRTYVTIDPTNVGLSKVQFSKYLDEMKKKAPPQK